MTNLSWPLWVLKFAQRVMALAPGRYRITLTVGERCDWTVEHMGKVEAA
jgi:hypothetical protein